MPTESGTHLPWPQGFGTPPRALMVGGAIFFALVAVVFSVRLFAAVSSDNPTGAAFGAAGVGLAVAFAAFGANLAIVRRSAVPKCRTDPNDAAVSGLVLPVDRKLIVLATVWSAAIAAFLGTYSIYLAFGSNGGGITAALAIPTALVMVAAMALLVALVRAASRRKYLKLTSQGVTLDNGMTHQEIHWHDIYDVIATTNPRFPMIAIRPKTEQGLRTLRAGRLMALPGNQRLLREMTFGPQAFNIDPALLYYTVQFYWQHPEARHELTSDAVVDRMSRNDLLH